MERVFLAVDVSNIWRVCKEKYGMDARVNFEVLKDIIPSLHDNPRDVEMEMAAYLITHPQSTHKHFEEVLTVLGYRVVEQCMDFVTLGDRTVPIRHTWDVGLALDAMEFKASPGFDTFVLATGDADYSQLIRKLQEEDKKTIVLSFETPISAALYGAADEFYFLSEDIVYRQNA